jgi:hypothetical protein
MLSSTVERPKSNEVIEELIIQEISISRRLEYALALNENKLLPELVHQVHKFAVKEEPYNLDRMKSHFRPNGTEGDDPLLVINWHIDLKMETRSDEKIVNDIIDLLVKNKTQTEKDRRAERDVGIDKENLLAMHGLGGDCRHLDGDYPDQPSKRVQSGGDESESSGSESESSGNESGWVEIEFWTAEYESHKVSILKGEIQYFAFSSGGSREQYHATTTRFSICPIDH